MNITIIRRSLWLVAVAALGYSAFAFWVWRPAEFIIAAGLFVILLPVDMLLAQVERERRLPPHGPVRKWGYHEHPVNTLWSVHPEAHRHLTVVDDRPARRWWRRLPWWAWIITLAVVPSTAAPFAPSAHALTISNKIVSTVVWTGAPECIKVWVPAPSVGGDMARGLAACSPDKAWFESYTATPGEWVGVDPEMSGAETLSCTLSINGDVVRTDFAVRDDGHEVTCLVKQ